MSLVKVYLIVDAQQRVRAAKRPRIGADEVAIAVNLRFPDTWGRVVATVDVTVPDFAPVIEEPAAGAAEPPI